MIEIGFELEFCADMSGELAKLYIQKHFPSIMKRDQHIRRNRFAYHFDASVELHSDRAFDSIEIVTPVWPLSQGMRALDKLLGILREIDAETNHTCGLHVNMGFSDEDMNRLIDPVRLLLHLDERKWLSLYGRHDSDYAMPLKTDLTDNLKYHEMDLPRNYQLAELTLGRVVKWSNRDHINSVSFKRLARNKSKGWVEFRLIGGDNYHKQMHTHKRAITHFADCLRKSTERRITPALEKRAKAALRIR